MATSSAPAPTAFPVRSAEASTDVELVAEVRRGDPRAFEELYARYQRRITAFVQAKVGDYGRAEELTQDVFLSALRRMRGSDQPIAFKPWIYEIAKNACIDQFRRSRRGEEVSYDADGGLAAADHGRLVARTPAPEAAAEQKQSLDDLLGAFGGLSQTHHEILVMRELEGRTYQQIGEKLGMSRPAVESTLFRARRRLGEEYTELVTGARCVRVQDLIETAGPAVPGARDRRRLSAHLSHCQPCRRHAAVAGLDVAELAPRGVRAKIAGLIPLPGFLWRRWSGEGATPSPAGASGLALTQWGAQVGSALDSTSGSWARAAAAILAVAGIAGGQAVSERRHPEAPVRSAVVTAAPARLAAATPAPAATPAGRSGARTVVPARPSSGRTAAPAATRRKPGFAAGAPRTPGAAPAAPAAPAGASPATPAGTSVPSPAPSPVRRPAAQPAVATPAAPAAQPAGPLAGTVGGALGLPQAPPATVLPAEEGADGTQADALAGQAAAAAAAAAQAAATALGGVAGSPPAP